MDSATVTQSEASAEAREISTPANARHYALVYGALAAYALLVAVTIHFHEPWADEAQAWLLARDASLADLWRNLLHYEGSPGLWQTLIHALLRLGLSYSAYNFVSAILALAAVFLLLRYAPLPLFIRILLPFTYYLCYQYAVVARSYALIAPLLFAIALIYREAPRKLGLITALLCLLAGISTHGFLISASLWAALYAPFVLGWNRLHAPERLKLVIAGIAYWSVLAFFILCAWPAKDVAFAEHRGLGNLHLFPDVAKATIAGAFTGQWMVSLFLIALSVPFLWRGGGLFFFALASAAFILFGTIVYAQLWHFGILFLAWLFAIWISAYKTRVTGLTLFALLGVIGFQFYWTAAAVRYDWRNAYSGSLAASQYLKQDLGPSGQAPGGLYAIGYSSTAIQPYFSRNIFSDFHQGDRPAYWDWSKRNTANDPVALFASDRREQVLVGYKNGFEKKHWADLLALLGYGLTRHFDGNTFWQTGVFESEAFDLYRQVSRPHAASSVNTNDLSKAAQLMDGFYGIEGGQWRWTARNFSVLLMAPAGSDRTGAQLSLNFYLSEAQVQKSGAVTVRAEIGGHSLPAQTFAKPEVSTYSVRVPADALRPGLVAVDFRLDKSSVGLNGDGRDLGIVVTAVNLDPAPPAQ